MALILKMIIIILRLSIFLPTTLLEFTAAQLYVAAEPDLPSHPAEGLLLDEGSPRLGQPALGDAGKGAREVVGDDEPEDCVPEELEALVVRDALGGVVGEGAMHERALEQRGAGEGVAEGLFELGGGR